MVAVLDDSTSEYAPDYVLSQRELTAVLVRGSKVERTLFLTLAVKLDIDKAAAGKQIDRITESVSS